MRDETAAARRAINQVRGISMLEGLIDVTVSDYHGPVSVWGSPVHGTRRRYAVGCRCEDCRRANREIHTAWARAAGFRPRSDAWDYGRDVEVRPVGPRGGLRVIQRSDNDLKLSS